MVVTTGMPHPEGFWVKKDATFESGKMGKGACANPDEFNPQHPCDGTKDQFSSCPDFRPYTVVSSTHKKKGRKNFKTCIYPLFRCYLKVAMSEGDSELTKRCAVLVKEHWTEIRILELLRRNSGMVVKV